MRARIFFCIERTEPRAREDSAIGHLIKHALLTSRSQGCGSVICGQCGPFENLPQQRRFVDVKLLHEDAGIVEDWKVDISKLK